MKTAIRNKVTKVTKVVKSTTESLKSESPMTHVKNAGLGVLHVADSVATIAACTVVASATVVAKGVGLGVGLLYRTKHGVIGLAKAAKSAKQNKDIQNIKKEINNK